MPFVLKRSSPILAITVFLAAVPGLASAQQLEYRVVSAQKWQYRDLLKTIEVKSPHGRFDQTKPSETTQAQTQPAETTNKDQVPTVDWRSTRWHMSREQVAASSRNITPTTTSERRDHSNPEVGVALLKGRYVAQEIQYTAFYWFHQNRLVAIAMKPSDPRHWSKVNAGLEQTYGTPIDDKSTTTSSGAMRCVVTDRKWNSEPDGNVIKFLAQDCNQNENLNFYSVRYEPILPTSITASVIPLGIGQAGVR